MSSQAERSASPKAAGSSFDLLSNSPETLDIEMTYPLTSVDEDSTQNSSVLPKSEDMSSFQSARERLERLNAARGATADSAFASHLTSSNGSTGAPAIADPYSTPGARGGTYVGGETNVPLSAVTPGPVYPTETQLGLAYGYGIRREDGSITRLLRADELEDLDTVPKSQGPEGLIILPPTRQLSPRRRQGPDPMISSEVIRNLPLNRPRRPAGPGLSSPSNPSEVAQLQIDSIIQRNASTAVTPLRPQRREKIYCDKWIHEGVCAFTQMGCKYLHEMPTDKATQVSLGLNHGIPTWFRRAQVVDLRPSPPANRTPPTNQNRLSGPWRRNETSSGGDIIQSGAPPRPLFGPIGPPSQSLSSFSNNPYAILQSESSNGDDEEDTITWTGRRR